MVSNFPPLTTQVFADVWLVVDNKQEWLMTGSGFQLIAVAQRANACFASCFSLCRAGLEMEATGQLDFGLGLSQGWLATNGDQIQI